MSPARFDSLPPPNPSADTNSTMMMRKTPRLHADSLQCGTDLLSLGDNPDVRIHKVLEESLELKLLSPEAKDDENSDCITYNSSWLRDHCYTAEARRERSQHRSLERHKWCAADLEADVAEDSAALEVSMSELLDPTDDDAGTCPSFSLASPCSAN